MDVFNRLSELRERGEPVALATVVACRRPASARPGDRALVLANGDLVGWIGGSCAQPTVQREGLRALADGQPRLVRLTPEAGLMPPQEGVVEDVMTCHSGGALEIYVEPFLPTPWLVVTGDSPIAEALTTLGALADFRVRRQLPEGAPHPPTPSIMPTMGPLLPTALRGRAGDEKPASPLPLAGEGLGEGDYPGGERYVVVAGLSGEDEHDLERALALDPSYVAFVGSRRRLGEVTARLRERGVSADQLARVKGPAGLDIGAVTAFEIALSIMAEIVQHRRRGAPSRPTPHPAYHGAPYPHGPAAGEGSHHPLSPSRERGPGGEGLPQSGDPSVVLEATDPVCGMRVAIAGARHVLRHEGQDHYFCCPSCRRLFAASPDQYRGAGSGRALPSTGDGAVGRE
jgi:xanthine dehydrogenase accessory factor